MFILSLGIPGPGDKITWEKPDKKLTSSNSS